MKKINHTLTTELSNPSQGQMVAKEVSEEKWLASPLKHRATKIDMTLVTEGQSEDLVRPMEIGEKDGVYLKKITYPLNPKKSGSSSRLIVSTFFLNKITLLPQASIKDLVEQLFRNNVKIPLPCRISYLGKTIGVAVNWEQFYDYTAFNLNLWYRATRDDPTQDIGTTLTAFELNGDEDEKDVKNLFVKRLKAPKSPPLGFVLPQTPAIRVAGDVPSSLAAIFIPLKGVINPMQKAAAILYKEENCPTTPDGAWIKYLVSFGSESESADDSSFDDSLEETLDEPREEGNEEAGITTATVAEARKRLRQQKFDALPDVLQGFDAFQALYAAAENKGFVEKTFAGTPMVVDRLRDEAIRMERNNDETERERLRELSGGKISPARALGTVVKGRLVFADKQVFKAMQQRRYSGRAMLRCLGKRPPYILPDIHVLAPHEFGQVPGFVAGQHRLQRDRLCVVMISYDPALWDLSLRERKALIEANKGPKLWVFPRQWLFDLSSAYHWWDAGWFGTPKDPSVLDFVVPDDDYQI